MGTGNRFRASPALLAGRAVAVVGLLCLLVPELLPAIGQGDPDARPEALDEGLAVQPAANEDHLVHLVLVIPPGRVAWAVADGLMHALKYELLVSVPLWNTVEEDGRS